MFLTPSVWKRPHYLIYASYAAFVGHLALGILQDQQNHVLTAIIIASAAAVGGLHLAAALSDRAGVQAKATWVDVGTADAFTEGRAIITILPDGSRVASFLLDGHVSAIANACAHQNGPLGEGRIMDCIVTCPWHGFQYDVRNGRPPAPFTEKVPTYNLHLAGGQVQVHADPNPPGTPTTPLPVRTGAT